MLLGALPSIALAIVVRRLWFHPLSKFPGPKIWAASRLPYVISLIKGTLNRDMLRFHEMYGGIIRLAPNELSFAQEQAWKDIYSYRPGHKETKKDPVWYIAPNSMPQNIVTTTDRKVRARMRKLLSPSFNEQSLLKQQPVLEAYAEILMNRLKDLTAASEAKGEGVVVNMLDWVNFFTVDVIGDLALGESFNCLQGSAYHPWVRTLHNFLKGMVYASVARFFPLTESLLQAMLPRQVLEKQKVHIDFTNEKILQRLESKADRPDFITPFLNEMNSHTEKMSLGEIQSTFAIVLVAGSETTATSLCGTLFELAKNPLVQEKLYLALRSRFQSEAEITAEATKGIPYLDAVINEALRLCFAIPGGLPRVVPEGGDTYVGEFVPGGTSISIRPYVVLRSNKYFTKPNDYVPERWLPAEERPAQFAADNLAVSQPFSVGPTNCLGKPLAWAEMRLLIARVIWFYDISMVKERPFDWDSQRIIMVVEKNPLWLKLKPRKS
ncbi:putative RNA polymerase II mediator complex component Srb8 [Glonium stellatum]|uniref:Putative RNA polymerase II mediator complex component Srb8 n=1 Tax=Glonium stellatum TaxID=574774 RepID=A0A8E2F304_9PEZI|nr:putative RNA polymerase II mediator complex component Srb8 [Glonium stellatum]